MYILLHFNLILYFNNLSRQSSVKPVLLFLLQISKTFLTLFNPHLVILLYIIRPTFLFYSQQLSHVN